MDADVPLGLPTRRIVDLFTYRCRLQLAALSTEIFDRLLEAQALRVAQEVDALRVLERQAQRRLYVRVREAVMHMRGYRP